MAMIRESGSWEEREEHNIPLKTIANFKLAELETDEENEEEERTKGEERTFTFKLAALQSESIREAARRAYAREDLGELDGHSMEAIPPETLQPSTPKIPDNIQGSEDLKECLRTLLSKYLDVFSKQVKSEPAKVTPLVIDVDRKKWEVIKNRLPARKLGGLRDAELERQCDLLLKMGVIEISKGGYYSYAFLVPKPNGDWRLVLDF